MVELEELFFGGLYFLWQFGRVYIVRIKFWKWNLEGGEATGERNFGKSSEMHLDEGFEGMI